MNETQGTPYTLFPEICHIWYFLWQNDDKMVYFM